MPMPEESGPSQPPSISGTTVGQLDPTQAARLHSVPGSRLSFASHEPLTASSNGRGLSRQDQLSVGKRIVIETFPNGRSTWRWVPKPKFGDSVEDEGAWPRVIDICGQHVLCSQEQWDIYKLDPEYICTVHLPGELTSITRRSKETRPGSSTQTQAKRRKEEASSDDELQTTKSPRKKARPVQVETDEEEDTDSDDEVEEMIIDGSDDVPADRAKIMKERRERIERHRKERRERNAARARKLRETEDLSMIDLTVNEEDSPTSSQPQTSTSKAHANSDIPQPQAANGYSTSNDVPPSPQPGMPATWTDSTSRGKTKPWTDASSSQSSTSRMSTSSSLQSSWTSAAESNPSQKSQPNAVPDPNLPTNTPGPSFAPFKKAKRTVESPVEQVAAKRSRITRSPTAAPADARNRSRSRTRNDANTRLGKLRAKMAGLRVAREQAFVDSIRAAVPEDAFRPSMNGTKSPGGGASRPAYAPEEDPISLEEKIKRIQEINAFEQERIRIAKEAAQKRAQEAEAEKRRKQEEQWARQREEAARERREREEEAARRKRRQQEEQERLRRQREAEELKRRQQQQERWSYGPWTSQRALERYRSLADAFDAAQFSVENPISFLSVPWPVLHKPTMFSVEDIDWQAVETFFATVKQHMRWQDYKIFVEKSHRRFHPDRWRARRVLQSLEDEELKACLEVAANTVAQAITPIWQEVKKP